MRSFIDRLFNNPPRRTQQFWWRCPSCGWWVNYKVYDDTVLSLIREHEKTHKVKEEKIRVHLAEVE